MLTSTVERVAQWLDSPAGVELRRQMAEQEATDRLDKRRSAAADLADCERRLRQLRAERDRTLGAKAADVTARESDLSRAREAYSVEAAQFQDQESALTGRCSRLRITLQESVSPLVWDFRQELRDDINRTYRSRDVVTERGRVVWNNHASIEGRVEALRAALAQSDTEHGPLVYEALSDEDLAGRIEAIRASFPSIETRPARYGQGIA